MKRVTGYILLGVMLGINGLSAQSVARSLIKNNLFLLGNYRYDSYISYEVTAGPSGKKTETEFFVLSGISYKAVFCQSGINNGLLIEVYDKSKAVKTRKKIFDNHSSISNKSWVFEISTPGQYYVEYTIPPTATGVYEKGYILMLLGTNLNGSSPETVAKAK